MDTLQSSNRHLMHKALEPFVGCLTAFITLTFWQDFLLSMFTAFMGGIVAYIAKKLCDHFYKKIKSHVKLRRQP